MKITQALKGALALVTVERTEDRQFVAMVPLDLGEGGEPRFGRIVRFDTYDADYMLPEIGGRIVVTAGRDIPPDLQTPGSIDILAVLGEPTLESALTRRGLHFAGETGVEAIDDFRAITALAQTIVAGALA